MLVDIKMKFLLEIVDSSLIFLQTTIRLYCISNHIQKHFCEISKQFGFVNQIYKKSCFLRYQLRM